MKNTVPSKATMSISSHIVFYIALYFLGAMFGFSLGWIIALILSELKIIYPPFHVLVTFSVAILGVYLPKNTFAKKVPAICPSCGGTAFLDWSSKPLQYVCTSCAHIHKTNLSLSGR
jgi:hypothetical protein